MHYNKLSSLCTKILPSLEFKFNVSFCCTWRNKQHRGCCRWRMGNVRRGVVLHPANKGGLTAVPGLRGGGLLCCSAIDADELQVASRKK